MPRVFLGGVASDITAVNRVCDAMAVSLTSMVSIASDAYEGSDMGDVFLWSPVIGPSDATDPPSGRPTAVAATTDLARHSGLTRASGAPSLIESLRAGVRAGDTEYPAAT
jgi:hypothetical protein